MLSRCGCPAVCRRPGDTHLSDLVAGELLHLLGHGEVVVDVLGGRGRLAVGIKGDAGGDER